MEGRDKAQTDTCKEITNDWNYMTPALRVHHFQFGTFKRLIFVADIVQFILLLPDILPHLYCLAVWV
jgi:hypothetical protein